ncbi:MAG TPA: heme-binding domain-containing protein [Ferruginibacter sp.]|nr:heme-binding domain-containing protein [Ferruginibacter sp.]
MRILKKIFLALLILLVLAQFIPRPPKNNNTEINANDITRLMTVPENVQAILKKSCYDCHSNNTHYPWYAKIQPVALFLNNHIEEGKRELNFSEFGSYKAKRQHRKLEEIIDQVKEGEMPLSSYTLIHGDAKLSTEQRQLLTDWALAADKILPVVPAENIENQEHK